MKARTPALDTAGGLESVCRHDGQDLEGIRELLRPFEALRRIVAAKAV